MSGVATPSSTTSLTGLTVGGGCAAKYSASRLEELLKGFVPAGAEDLLVGLDPADDAAVYPDYTGDYEVAPGMIVSVSAAGNRLRWHLSAAEEDGDPLDGDLVARSRARFRIPEYDMGVTFVRDEHGNVTHTLNDDGHLAKKIR